MRFSPGLFVTLLLCSVAHDSKADAALPVSIADAASSAAAADPADATAVIEADSMGGKKGGQVEASGDVKLRQGGQSIRADYLLYQQHTHDVDARGDVVLEQDGNTIGGPQLRYNLDSGAGSMEQPHYYLQDNDGRGRADRLYFHDRLHYSLDNATYTTCPAGDQDWQMKMGTLEIDRDRHVGVARSARVEFKGVPILYTPWMDFPLNDRRKSGFLAPVFGGTSKGGTEVTLPFYWNIAANRDATIAPRYILKRGLMFNNELRYLEPGFNGEIHADALPRDALAGRTREHFSLAHNHALADGWNGFVNFNRVWDDAYYRDLGDAVNTTSQANLLQESGMNYYADSWRGVARLQRYQTLQDPAAPIAVPYARLPQLTVDAAGSLSAATLALAGEFVAFSHPTELNARRLVLNPSISYPLVSESAYYLTPKIGLHNTRYVMGENNAAARPNVTRTLPIVSVDSGFSLERDSNMFGGDYLQTFEPRAFYVYIPYRDQNQLPIFDTAQADFSFTQMFTENRFLGSDRIGDANQVTLAATSRLLDKNNGAERLKVMLGERFSFRSPRVNLAAPATSTGKSDILLAASGQVTPAFGLDSEFQHDPNQNHTQRYNIAAHYRPGPGEVFNFGYRFQRNTLRQADLSAQWPLSSRWHAVGRLNYSLPDSRVLDSIAGLEYNRDCWTLRFVAQHFTTATQQTNTGFFAQLELNGFVKVGADPLGLLKQSVPGYTELVDQPVHQSLQALPDH